MNQQTEDEFYSNYNSVDGKCKKKECTCPNGGDIDETECNIDGLEICDERVKCDEGYYMGDSPPVCKKQTEGDNVYKECSCLHGSPRIEDSSITRCNPSDSDFADLPVIRQYCNNTSCASGYEIATGVNAVAQCNEYYPEDKFENINCCLPKYDTCILEESELSEKNIGRKNKSNQYTLLQSKNLSELKDEYETKSGESISSDDLLNEDNPKQYLINLIIQNSDEEEETCHGNIDIKTCYADYQCKPGYSFLPSTSYSSENELRITGCETSGTEGIQNVCYPLKNCAGKNVQSLEIVGVDIKADGEVCKFPSHFSSDEITGILTKYGILDDQAGAGASPPKCSDPGTDNTCGEQECFIKQIQPYYPTWNGTCVPVSCNLSDDIKNIYNIPYDTCDSGSRNCGLNNVTCKNSDFEIPNTRRMLYCPSPQKVDSSYQTKED